MGSIPGPPHEEEFTYRSKLPDITIPDHLPLHAYCFQDLPAVADRPCIVHGPTGDVYTYAQVERTARRVAAGLRRAGVRRGDVVMLLLPNSPEFVFAFLGASYRGATATTANPLYTPAEVRKQAVAAGARLVVTQSAYVDKVLDLKREAGVVVVCTDGGGEAEGCLRFSELVAEWTEEEEEEEEEIGAEEVVAMPFSSGTTGLAKGVMVTHGSLVASVSQQVGGENPNLWLRKGEDVVLCVLPLFHIYCLNTVLLCGLRAGAAILVMPRFEVGAVLEMVQRHRVTVAPLVPPILLSLLKCPDLDRFDLSSLRAVIYGAAPVGTEVVDALRAKIPGAVLGQGYGMTEAGCVSMCLGLAREAFETKEGSCGTVVRNAQLKVVDPATGASQPRNQPGEICIRGPQLMKGYLNDPEATAGTIDKDGWLHTGDIGYVDDNDEIFIVDRLKELIKYKGFQVPPAELEALLVTHPGISDAAVVPMKDEIAGELPVAFVVRSNGSTVITEDEIKQYISKQVVFYKKIHRVFFVEVIPKAPSGKTLRKGLREKIAAGLADTCHH